jgi:hypothetical protein
MTGSILLIDGGAANVDVAGAALAMAGVNWGVSEMVFFDGWKALSRFFDNRMCAASRTNDRKSVMKMRPLQTDLSGFSRLNLERSPVWIGIISYLGSCEISGDLILL